MGDLIRTDWFPLLPGQRGFLAAQKREPGRSYSISRAFHITGKLDVDRFVESVQLVVDARDSLRLEFAHDKEVQRVLPRHRVRIDLLQPVVEDTDQLERYIAYVLHSDSFEWDVFDPAHYRFRILRISSEIHIFLMSLQHITADARSQTLIADEVFARYAGRHPDDSHTDVSSYRKACLTINSQSSDRDREREYWQRFWETTPSVLELKNQSQGRTRYSRLRRIDARIADDLYSELQIAADRCSCTTAELLLSRFGIAVLDLSLQEAVVVDVLVDTRGHRYRDVAGNFLLTLPVRISRPVSGDFVNATRVSLWKSLAHRSTGKIDNEDLRIAAASNQGRSFRHAVSYNYLGSRQLGREPLSGGDIEVRATQFEPPSNHEQYIILRCVDYLDSLHIILEYRDDVVTHEQAQGVVNSLCGFIG